MTRHKRQLQQLTIDGAPEVVAEVDLSPKWGGKRPGAGRRKGVTQTVTISLRIPVALRDAIIEVVDARHDTITQYLTEMLIREVSIDLDMVSQSRPRDRPVRMHEPDTF